MEKILVPIDKRLYDVICLTWKDYDPNEVTDDMIAGDITDMLIYHFDQLKEEGALKPNVAEAFEDYVRALCAEERERNRGPSDD